MLRLGEIEYDLTLNLAGLDAATKKAVAQMQVLDRRMETALGHITRSSEGYAKRAKIVGVESENTVKALTRRMEMAARSAEKEIDRSNKKADEALDKSRKRAEKEIVDAQNKFKQTSTVLRKEQEAQQRHADRMTKIFQKAADRAVAIESDRDRKLALLGLQRQKALLREEMAIDSYTNKLVGDLKRQEAAIRRTAYAWKSIGGDLGHISRNLAFAFGAVVAPMAYMIKNGAELSSKMTLASKGFELITGSTRQAATMMRQLREETVYSFLNLQQTLPLAQRLAGAFGPRQIGRVIPTLRAIGGAVVAGGGGYDQQQRAVNAISSMVSQRDVSKRFLDQLSRAMPTARIYDILQQSFGTSVAAELKKQGRSAEEVVITILNNLDKRFGDYQKKLTRNTLPGLISGITDSFQFLGAALTEKHMPVIIKALQQLFDMLQNLQKPENASSLKALGTIFDALLSPLSMFITAITKLVDWFTKLSPANQQAVASVVKWGTISLGVGAFFTKFLQWLALSVGAIKLLSITLKGMNGPAEQAAEALAGASTQSKGLLGWLRKLVASPWIIRVSVVAVAAAGAALVKTAYDKARARDELTFTERQGTSGLAEIAQIRGIIQNPRLAAHGQLGGTSAWDRAVKMYRDQFGSRADIFKMTAEQRRILLSQLGGSTQRMAAYGAEEEDGLPTAPPAKGTPKASGSTSKYINQIRATRRQTALAGIYGIRDETQRRIALIHEQTQQVILARQQQAAEWVKAGVKTQAQASNIMTAFIKAQHLKEAAQIAKVQEEAAKKHQAALDNLSRRRIALDARLVGAMPQGRNRIMAQEGIEERRTNLSYNIMMRGQPRDIRIRMEAERLEALHQLRISYGKKLEAFEEAQARKQIAREQALLKREEQINADIADTQIKRLLLRQRIMQRSGYQDFEGQRGLAIQIADLRADKQVAEYNMARNPIEAAMNAAKTPELKAQYLRILDKMSIENAEKADEIDAQSEADLQEIDQKEQDAIQKRLKGLTDYYDAIMSAFSKRTRYDDRPQDEILRDRVAFRRRQMTTAAINNPLVTLTDWWQEQGAANESDTEQANQIGSDRFVNDAIKKGNQIKSNVDKLNANQAVAIDAMITFLNEQMALLLKLAGHTTESVATLQAAIDAANEAKIAADEAFQKERNEYIEETQINDLKSSARGRNALLSRYGVRGRRRRDAQAQLQAIELLDQLKRRRKDDAKYGVPTSPEYIQQIESDVNKLLKPRSIWDDLKEDAQAKFGNIVDSFSDAVGQMAARGGSLKNWWKNLWGEMVSWFMSFVVRNVVAGIGRMVTGQSQQGLFGGGGGGGLLGAVGSILGGGGQRQGTPPIVGGSDPEAQVLGTAGGIVGIGGKGGLLGRLGLGGIGGFLAKISPWLAGAALLWKPIKSIARSVSRGVSKVWKGVKKLFHFDDPINDMNAAFAGSSVFGGEQSGRDFTAQFAKGVARGMARMTMTTMGQNGGMMALMSGTGPGRQMLARIGGVHHGPAMNIPTNGFTLVNNINNPVLLNRQSIATISDMVDQDLASKIQFRVGRGTFAGRDRR